MGSNRYKIHAERQVGKSFVATFQTKPNMTLKVVPRVPGHCEECYFFKPGVGCSNNKLYLTGECVGDERSDGTYVAFKRSTPKNFESKFR